MKKFRKNPTTMSEGSLLVRRMSEKAQKYYNNNEGVGVWTDDRNDNEGIFVAFYYGMQPVEFTFKALEEEFESLQDELDHLLGIGEDESFGV